MREIVSALCFLFGIYAVAQTKDLPISAGTRLRVQMESTIDTKTSHVGDAAEVMLIELVERNNVVLLPIGTRLHGRVATVHAEDKKQKIHALLQLSFDAVILSDGRKLKTQASIQNLGASEDVNSEGVVTKHPFSTDFKLKSGRKLWVRLNEDLELSPQAGKPPAQVSSIVAESAVPKPAEVPQQNTSLSQPALSAGTRLRAKMESTVDTKSSRVGDGADAILIEPVTRDNVVVLPVGTRLHGRVATIRAADKKQKIHALLRLSFDEVILPGGQRLKTRASIQSLGVSEAIDSEGAATTPGVSKGKTVEATATSAAAGAGIGAIAGGGEGAGIGAGVGGAVGLLSALAAGAGQWDNFELKNGRKLWLRLDEDLLLVSSATRE